ncbi:MAG: Piwi domain-containing protein [Bacteroidota bacterium]
MTEIKQNIVLNFLPLNEQEFSFSVFRRKAEPQEKKWDEKIIKYKLPDNPNDDVYKNYYWVSFSEFVDSELFQVNALTNVHLTEWYLHNLLHSKVKSQSIINKIDYQSKFNKWRIYFSINSFKEGTQSVWLEPYYLNTKQKFGFLIGFRFFKTKDYSFNKRVQQLSLSLDSDGRSNKNFHIDSFNLFKQFIGNLNKAINPIVNNISVSQSFEPIESDLLDTKIYEFGGGKTSNSQFNGIMSNGPFQQVNNNLQYVFLFREAEKPLMIELMKALNGDKYSTFKGLEKFKLPRITPKVNLIAIRIDDFSDAEIEKAIAEIPTQGNTVVISVFPKNEERFYYLLKNRCLKENILLQVVHNETIQNEYIFKWSVSSIGLQIFSKLGGTPWLVKSSQQKTLMIGIARSQDFDEESREIKRFYAYSVLIESTGKFVSIQPLANNDSEDNYLKSIAENIATIINNNKAKYSKIVFHLPYKIKQEEIDKIKHSIQSAESNLEITLIKINDSSKYYGFNNNANSLVPYESTYAKISGNSYLLWTEGLNYHDNRPIKRYANPIFIEFLHSTKKDIIHKDYLQELLNLSGANYRGFNAKSLPVSVFYPKLISEFNKHFSELSLENIVTENNKPWFL